eukprot:INCI14746.13.p1 GENE.INCI14746.13~~INCI14746.13.p1  ORF type:complete len:150 (-),score=9.53 INCI14746.13:32-481(-)
MPPEALSSLAGTPANETDRPCVTLDQAKAWDTYSFGCLVACVFNCCVAPYPQLDERVVMVKVLLSDLRPEPPIVLTNVLQNLLATMWDKSPAKRPSMEQVLDELDRAGNSPFNIESLNSSGSGHDHSVQIQSQFTTEATGSNSQHSASV